jgi:hypothetical protein
MTSATSTFLHLLFQGNPLGAVARTPTVVFAARLFPNLVQTDGSLPDAARKLTEALTKKAKHLSADLIAEVDGAPVASVPFESSNRAGPRPDRVKTPSESGLGKQCS